MNPNDLTPEEAKHAAAFDAVLAKLAAIGWVERIKPGAKFKDVRFTGGGVAGLQNIHVMVRALGGLTGTEAELLFFIARKMAEDVAAETN